METITEKNFQQPVAEPAITIVKFTNFTTEDFTYTWNKIPYTFKAGSVKYMEKGIADHFAKHLVNRELLNRGRENDTSPKKPSENVFFMELYNQCISSIPFEGGESDQTKIEQEIIDRNMKEKLGENVEEAPAHVEKESATPAKKGGKKLKAKKEEEEFEVVDVPKGDDDDE